MSWLSEFAKGGKNPASAAKPYLDQIPRELHGGYDPYISRGTGAADILTDQLGRLTSNPAAFLEAINQNYRPSSAYNLKRDEALRAAGNTAAAGGMRGSEEDIENASKITSSLMGDDMQQWLSNVLGLYKKGLEGEGGLYNTGFNASDRLTSDMSNLLGTQGQLAFQGQNEKNQRNSDLFSSITKGLGAVGGALLGGPVGGAAGSWLANKLVPGKQTGSRFI